MLTTTSYRWKHETLSPSSQRVFAGSRLDANGSSHCMRNAERALNQIRETRQMEQSYMHSVDCT
eukprot:scaffold153968_cov22-Prasinocladus_malaysianus.AAC.2